MPRTRRVTPSTAAADPLYRAAQAEPLVVCPEETVRTWLAEAMPRRVGDRLARDLVTALMWHGVEVVVGLERAYTLLKILTLPWGAAYIKGEKLAGLRGRTHQTMVRHLRWFTRPWQPAQPPDADPDALRRWSPPLFFKQRRRLAGGSRPWVMVPNLAGWAAFFAVLFGWSGERRQAAHEDAVARKLAAQVRRGAAVRRHRARLAQEGKRWKPRP